MGWMGVLWAQGGFAPGKPVHLTQEQVEALRWATSAEGKFARNLMKWNSDSQAGDIKNNSYLNIEITNEAQQ